MLRAAILSALIVLAPAGAAVADTYVQDFEAGLSGDGFVEALTTPPGDDWQARVEDGVFVLENRSAAGAVRYYDFNRTGPGGAPALQTEASVSVSGDFEGEAAGAGLLARFDPETRTYYAFVRTADGVALYKRGPERFSRLMNLDGPVRGADGPVTLGMRLTPEGTQLFVNDRSIGTVSSQDVQGDRFGIVAIDRGTFRFDDFSVTTE